jgi:hypothetical protein
LWVGSTQQIKVWQADCGQDLHRTTKVTQEKVSSVTRILKIGSTWVREDVVKKMGI